MKPDQTSWHEEHQEFLERSQKIKIGDHWKFGFYQDIPEDIPPKTRIKDNSIYEFLVPEEHLSLKLFFDNLRNYGISAAFAALGAALWIARRRIHDFLVLPEWVAQAVAITTWALVTFLLFMNVMQTWFLSNELLLSIRSMRIKTRIYRATTGVSALLAFFHAAAYTLTDWFILVCIRFVAIVLVLLCIAFVGYAVLASPGLRSVG